MRISNLLASGRLFLTIRLIFHAEFKSVASVGDAEDRTADFLWFAGTGTFLFQTDEDRLRLNGCVELILQKGTCSNDELLRQTAG